MGLSHQYHYVTASKANSTATITLELKPGEYTLLGGGEYPSLQEFKIYVSDKDQRIAEAAGTSGRTARVHFSVLVSGKYHLSIYVKKCSNPQDIEICYFVLGKSTDNTTAAASGNSSTFLNDREAMNLKGAVKSISLKSYDANADFKPSDNETLTEAEHTFNSKGFLTKTSEQYSDCTPCYYSYAPDGKKASINTGKLKLKLRYSKKGSLLVEDQFESEDLEGKEDWEDLEQYGVKTYVLDESGRVKEETEYYDEKMQHPMSRTRKTYDTQGRMTAQFIEEFDDDAKKWKISVKAEYSNFDEQGNPRLENRFDENMKNTAKISKSYIYDQQKNWIEERLSVVQREETGKLTTEYYVTKRLIKY